MGQRSVWGTCLMGIREGTLSGQLDMMQLQFRREA